MITDNNVELARSNLKRASKELGFDVETPYTIKESNKTYDIFAFLPKLGSQNGMYLGITNPPEFQTDHDLIRIAKERNIFCGFINLESILNYRKEVFEEAVSDWAAL